MSRNFTRNWTFRSDKLDKCAFISVESRMTGYWEYAYRLPDGSLDPNTLKWTDVTLHDPSVRVVPWKTLGAGCDSTTRWGIRAIIKQGWHERSCGLSVDVQVGYPWSLGATPNINCQTNRLGWEESEEG